MRIRTVSGLPSPVRTRPTDGGDRTKANVVALNNRTGPRQPIAGKLPSVLNGRRPEPLSNDLSFDGVGSLHRRLGTDSHIHVRLATSQTKWPRGTTGCDAGRLPSDLRGVKLTGGPGTKVGGIRRGPLTSGRKWMPSAPPTDSGLDSFLCDGTAAEGEAFG